MSNRTHTMQDVIESILHVISYNAKNREQGDVERTNHCAGRAQGMAQIFRFLNVEYDFGTWQDGEYEMVGYFYVDGVVLVKNGEIDWRAYSNAVLDDDHSWGSKELKIA